MTLNDICRALVRMNTPESLMHRAVLAAMFQGVGRAEETQCLSTSLLSHCPTEQAPINNWPNKKTGKEVFMPFFPMSPKLPHGWGACFYHGLASFLVTARGELKSDGDEPDWIFNYYRQLSPASVASVITKVIRQFVETIEGVTVDMTSHGLRAGAADTMAFNLHCHIVAIIMRGDWDWKGECQLFGYLTAKLYLALAGKALAYWPDCRQKVTPPRLDTVLDNLPREEQDKVRRLCYMLFEDCPEYFHTTVSF